MSVPPDRMVARNASPNGDPNKIMGLSKPVFFVVVALALVLAYIIYKRSGSTSAPDTTDSNAGLTAADIGGIPADSNFATDTDESALEEQLQSMQDSLAQMNQNAASAAAAGLGNLNVAGTPVGTGLFQPAVPTYTETIVAPPGSPTVGTPPPTGGVGSGGIGGGKVPS